MSQDEVAVVCPYCRYSRLVAARAAAAENAVCPRCLTVRAAPVPAAENSVKPKEETEESMSESEKLVRETLVVAGASILDGIPPTESASPTLLIVREGARGRAELAAAVRELVLHAQVALARVDPAECQTVGADPGMSAVVQVACRIGCGHPARVVASYEFRTNAWTVSLGVYRKADAGQPTEIAELRAKLREAQEELETLREHQRQTCADELSRLADDAPLDAIKDAIALLEAAR